MWTIITPFIPSTDSRAKRLAAALSARGFSVCLNGYATTLPKGRFVRRLDKYVYAIKQLRAVQGGVVVSVNAEYTLLARAMKFMRLTHFDHLVADIYDHHAYIFRGLMGLAFHCVERLSVNMADAAIIPIRKRLDQYRPPITASEQDRIFYISNIGFSLRKAYSFADGDSSPNQSQGRCVVVYAGTIDFGRGLGALTESAAEFADLDVRIYGSGPLLKEYLKDERFERIYRGEFDVSSLRSIYEPADVICGFYEPSVPNNRFCDPNKLRETFEFHKPLLTNAGTPLSERVEALGVGLVVDRVSKESIREGALEILKQKGYLEKRIDAGRGHLERLVRENTDNLERLIGLINGS